MCACTNCVSSAVISSSSVDDKTFMLIWMCGGEEEEETGRDGNTEQKGMSAVEIP